jgi:hypothetical protein
LGLEAFDLHRDFWTVRFVGLRRRIAPKSFATEIAKISPNSLFSALAICNRDCKEIPQFYIQCLTKTGLSETKWSVCKFVIFSTFFKLAQIWYSICKDTTDFKDLLGMTLDKLWKRIWRISACYRSQKRRKTLAHTKWVKTSHFLKIVL